MTAPVSHGYPDFGRYVAQSTKTLLRLQATTLNVDTDYDLGFVGDLPAVHVVMSLGSVRMQFRLQFFEEASFTNSNSEHIFAVDAFGTINTTFPTMGPYLRLRVEIASAGGTFTPTITLAPSGFQAQAPTAMANLLLGLSTVNIAAGATTTVTATRSWPGEAYWTVGSAAATWTALLRALRHTSAVVTYDKLTQARGYELRRVLIPPMPMQIRITNTTGAAADFDYVLAGKPVWLGA